MATLAGTLYTTADLAKLQDPNGSIGAVIEMLAQKNGAIQDIPWMEGNLPTGHRTILRTGLPTVAWRLLNQGTAPSKATTAQSDEAAGILEGFLEVDELVANLNGNSAAFQTAEAAAFIQAMNQEFEGTLFYGNHGTSPEEFQGFAPRFNSLTGTTGDNIIGAGGTGSDNSSIWLVVWGDGVHGIYPKGSNGGLTHTPLGLQTVYSSAGLGSGNRLRAIQHLFRWQCGLAIPDWQQVARICNIDISALVAESSDADLSKQMLKAVQRVRDLQDGKPVWYMNRSVFQYLTIQRRDDVKTGGQLSYTDVDGRLTYFYMGIPIRISDQLTEAEATIS